MDGFSYTTSPSNDASKEHRKIDTVEIHQKALDDLVNVNSLFTIAVFVGLTAASPGQHSLQNRPECDADPRLAKRLVMFEVISFGSFLLSSLVAKALKFHLNIYQKEEFKKWYLKMLRGFMLSLSALASLLGVLFLILSTVNVIQIKIGKLSCGSEYTFYSIASLWAIVALALSVYAPSMVWAIWLYMKYVESEISANNNNKESQSSTAKCKEEA